MIPETDLKRNIHATFPVNMRVARLHTLLSRISPPLLQSDSPLIVENNVKKFMRYHIPPEVKITHGLRMSSNSGDGAGGGEGEAQIATTLSNGGPRNMRSSSSSSAQEQRQEKN